VSHFFPDEKKIPLDNRHSQSAEDFDADDARPSDTGHFRHLQSMVDQGQMTKTEGTWAFWSPEMCAKEPFSGYGADIWAAGIVLFIMLTGDLPYYDENPTDLFDKITDQPIPFPTGFSKECLDCLHKVLEKVSAGFCCGAGAGWMGRARPSGLLSERRNQARSASSAKELCGGSERGGWRGRERSECEGSALLRRKRGARAKRA
jgi:serine/threonine protein kinase